MKRGSKARSIADLLTGPDLRKLLRTQKVVELVEEEPDRLRELVDSLLADQKAVRMRAADALEKISRRHPDWLHPYRDFLLEEVATIPQQEIRWHLAQIIPRLALGPARRKRAVRLLSSFLSDKSSIVRTWALNGLFLMSQGDRQMRLELSPIFDEALLKGTPAMKARLRRLLHMQR